MLSRISIVLLALSSVVRTGHGLSRVRALKQFHVDVGSPVFNHLLGRINTIGAAMVRAGSIFDLPSILPAEGIGGFFITKRGYGVGVEYRSYWKHAVISDEETVRGPNVNRLPVLSQEPLTPTTDYAKCSHSSHYRPARARRQDPQVLGIAQEIAKDSKRIL